MTENDQRGAFRVAMDRNAVLRIGRKDQVVNLIDASASGFCILCDKRPKFSAKKVIQLRTANGWCLASLVHCTETPDGWRVGLLNVGDLKDPRFDGALPADKDDQLSDFMPSDRATSTVMFTLIALAAAVYLHFAFPDQLGWWKPIAEFFGAEVAGR
ncbi:MAG: PilZ domain-containing protein [Pirellulaceae bacterium]|jgi:hypothetical protein|nr:PilZ domain-containing protein [Pirellulaceae bacterium]